MLTVEDCLGMCDLTEDEVNAIARHEHISEMAAVLLAEELIYRADGAIIIQKMLLDEILRAQEARDAFETKRRRNVLERFVATHPARQDVGQSTSCYPASEFRGLDSVAEETMARA